MGDPDHNGGKGRTFADVQRHGLAAASALVDGLTRTSHDDGTAPDPPAPPAPSAPAGPEAPSAPAVTDELTRLWAEAARMLLALFGQVQSAVPGSRAGTAADTTVDVVDGTTAGVVRLHVAPSPSGGGHDTAVVWLHNGSGADVPDVALHSGDLRSSEGVVLPADGLRFDPPSADLPARSSRGILVTVAADAAPGVYRGVLLARGVPEAWLPVEVAIAVPGGER